MKKYFKKITMFILSFAVIFTLFSCGGDEEAATPDDGFEFGDMIETPNDIPPLADLNYAEYPKKPEGITAGQGSGLPRVGQAYTDSEYYQLSQADGKITVSFYEVDKWDYIYIPIENFNAEYQNIKVTATGTNVQKIAFAAVYYEMYDLGYPAMATLTQDIGDSEQYYIMELGKIKLLDEAFNPLEDVLGNQTVIGLCVFIDSNPAQPTTGKNTSKESKFEISNIEFLKDGDPSIADKYVAPSLNVGYYDGGYSVEKNDETKQYTIVKDPSAGIWTSASLNISNYSSFYSAFTLDFNTQGINTLTIELVVSGGLADWAESVTVYKGTNLTDGAHVVDIDFSSTQPVSTKTWDVVPGYYIKNYKISAIKFLIDTATETELNTNEGTLLINEVKFERIATEGTLVNKGWNAGSASIKLGDDIAAGGIGTVYYSFYNTWEYLTMPVLNYETSNKLVVQFQANEGIDYLGIALGSASYPLGESVIKSCWYKVNTIEPKSGEFEGMVETVDFDAANNIYTITFDFTNSVKYFDGKSINEMLITSLRFYFTDPNTTAPFEGTRSIRFIKVAFE